MSTQDTDRKQQYSQARDAFDDLRVEDKALFLVEAAVSTIARGLEEAGRIIGKSLDDVFGGDGAAGEPPEAAPAEPEAPAEAPKAKKTTARKKSTTRKATRKSPPKK